MTLEPATWIPAMEDGLVDIPPAPEPPTTWTCPRPTTTLSSGDAPADIRETAAEGEPEIPADIFPLPSGEIGHVRSAEVIFGVIAPTHRLFYRGGNVVEVEDQGGELALSVVTPERFASLVETFGHRVARRETGRDRDGGIRDVWRSRTYPIGDAKVALESDPARRLPHIRQLCAVPVLASGDGDVMGRGWHPFAGGTLVTGGGEVPEIPLEEAVCGLLSLLEDFHFASPSDRTRAFASLLSPALKAGGWIGGDFPLDVGEARASQSGKTYRLKLVAALYGEEWATITTRNGGVGSLDEDVSRALIRGRPFILLDNMKGRVDSSMVETAIRGTGFVDCRALRESATVDTRPFTWALTTNGAELSRDLANRSIITRIGRWEGGAFRQYAEGDVLAHVKANHPRFLGCVFAILREWWAQGCPLTCEDRHDFREWCRALDHITGEIAGLPPLLDGHREEQERAGNPRLVWLREVALALAGSGGDGEPTSAAEIAELVEEAGIDWPGNDQESNGAIKVGRIMKKLFQESQGEAIVVDGVTVERRDVSGVGSRWRYTFRR